MQDQYLELFKIYKEEAQYRHENLWKRLIQFFIIIFFTSTLPITIHIFGEMTLPAIPLSIFPITGMFLTAFYLWYSLSESIRMKMLDLAIKAMMEDLIPEKYRIGKLTSLVNENRKAHPIFYLRISVWVPVFFSVIEFAVSVFMLILIYTNAL